MMVILTKCEEYIYTGFHPGFFKWGGGGGGGGGPASLTSQILYLITTLGKSLTRSFPDEDILSLQ